MMMVNCILFIFTVVWEMIYFKVTQKEIRYKNILDSKLIILDSVVTTIPRTLRTQISTKQQGSLEGNCLVIMSPVCDIAMGK